MSTLPAVGLGIVAVYLGGWLAATAYFGRIQGPVPVPGRFRRDLRDGGLWPCWLVLYLLFWLLGRRRQAFERDLEEEWRADG